MAEQRVLEADLEGASALEMSEDELERVRGGLDDTQAKCEEGGGGGEVQTMM
jgi:hypothetical protein